MSEPLCPHGYPLRLRRKCRDCEMDDMEEENVTLRRQLDVANDLLIRLEIATNLQKSIYEYPLHAFNAVHEEVLKAQAEIAKLGGEK